MRFFLVILTVVGFASAPAIAQGLNEDVQNEIKIARFAMEQKEYGEAAEHFLNANKLMKGRCFECLSGLVEVRLATGKNQQALQDAGRALLAARTGRQKAIAHIHRATAFLQLAEKEPARLGDAEAAFRLAVAADPKCLDCKFNVGYVLLKQGKDAEGVQFLKALLPEAKGKPLAEDIQKLIEKPERARKDFAPEFSAILKTGEAVSLKQLQGKLVLLDFWGAWCEPCRASLPSLKRLAESLDPAKAVVISIDEHDSRETWTQFVEKNGMTWPQIFDENGELAEAFAVDSAPHYFLLDQEGVILARYDGWSATREQEIRKRLETAIRK
ncbi:MAG TPA: redoxin domain-containing protein [Candidatus Limnocylindrales bacterium]|nr:redoxin domain-containing protein [Candidatus Limnocylindrales bacterium]